MKTDNQPIKYWNFANEPALNNIALSDVKVGDLCFLESCAVTDRYFEWFGPFIITKIEELTSFEKTTAFSETAAFISYFFSEPLSYPNRRDGWWQIK